MEQDELRRKLLAMKPTPGIERMTRDEAKAYFEARVRRLRDQIDSLPPSEMLRLAADLLDAEAALPGSTPAGWARTIAERALQKLGN